MFLLTVAAIWTIAAITPGPNFLSVARCSVGGDLWAAFACVAGTVCGTLVWGLAGWLGISALFAAAPSLFVGLKALGASYILWLGWKLLRGAWQNGPVAGREEVAARLTAGKAFRIGLLTNLANPKTAIFVASIFASALPADHHWATGPAAVALMAIISGVWYLSLALCLSRPAMRTVYLAARRKIDAAAGALFTALGLRMLLNLR